MTGFRGFKTEAEAKKFAREHGGLITTRVPTPSGREPASLNDYMMAVYCGGLDKEAYPYCVQWVEK